ncbi:N-acetyltransferase [Sphingomonas yunnanensis]|uniref:GNAT family N-acetyltransferase n=1 Tax=Sphingomonas yunnanensis TaxID=310400 RepID=UPI001CA69512|nr:N-acetyltransferase [Sphingomonas yunnanensis]MBY9063428.1 N-acetyltransferase [Sphingomonas yunnanensis]
MKAAIAVRAECPGDVPAISEIVVRAYDNVIYSDHREHLMIERLRGTGAWIPPLSLLAEVDGRAVGHILLTRASICGSGSCVETLALAPLSVVPDYQSRGVGKRLVEAACQRALELGFDTIVLVGLPSYYPRFGFEPMSRYPITLPFDAPGENCMILPLRPGALDGIAGVVKYAEEWLEH